MIVCVPEALGVYVTEQVELEPVATESVQVALGEKLPEALVVSVTEPAGLDLVPESVSVTVAVQVELWLIATEDGLQLIDVAGVRLFTVRAKPVVSELLAWTLSAAL